MHVKHTDKHESEWFDVIKIRRESFYHYARAAVRGKVIADDGQSSLCATWYAVKQVLT